MTREVTFEPVDEPILDRTDETYRKKYEGANIIESMNSERGQSATVEILPHKGD